MRILVLYLSRFAMLTSLLVIILYCVAKVFAPQSLSFTFQSARGNLVLFVNSAGFGVKIISKVEELRGTQLAITSAGFPRPVSIERESKRSGWQRDLWICKYSQSAHVITHKENGAISATTESTTSVTVPFLLAVIVLTCSLLVEVISRCGRTVRHDVCMTCGYDLRSHKCGEKCPECGRLIGAFP
jgi:hypothetical protein